MEATKRNFYLVLGLFLLAVLIRSWNLSYQSYSNDEVIELEDARLSLPAMVLAADSFPPLFRLMLAAVLRITAADIAGRWMSVLLGALCIPFAYGCGRLVGDQRVGLLSALLVAFSPICVYYAQEVRPYTLYMLAGAAMLYTGLAAIKEDNSNNWVRFAIAAILACYVHYYSALMVIAIYCAWLLDRMSSKLFRRGLLALLGIALGCVPALFLVATDFAFTEDHSAIEVGVDIFALGYTFFSFLAGFTFGPSISALHELSGSPAVALRAFLPAILITGVTVALPLVWGVWQLRKDRCALSTVGFAAILPVLLAAALSLALGLNYNVRYVVVSVIPCLILVAAGVGGLRPRSLMIVATLAILAWYANGIMRRHQLPEYHNEDVAAAAEWLAVENSSQHSVYVISDYMARTLRFYTRDDVPVFGFPEADGVMVRVESDEQLRRVLAEVAAEKPEGCWFAVTRAFHGDPTKSFRNWLAEDQGVQWGASFAGIELFRWTPSKQ